MASRTIVVDKGWKRIRGQCEALHGRGVKVGIRSAGAGGGKGKRRRTGGETRDERGRFLAGTVASDVDIIDYAMWNEFGTERIPARPFMRQTADENEARVSAYARRLANAMIAGRMNVDGVLDALGLYYQARIRSTIRNAFKWAAPNAPSTIARKGSSHPLVDTGTLAGAVDFEKF